MDIEVEAVGPSQLSVGQNDVSKSVEVLSRSKSPESLPRRARLSSSLPNMLEGKKTKLFSLKRLNGLNLTKTRSSVFSLSGASSKDKGIKKNLFGTITGSMDSDDSDVEEQRFVTKRGFLHIHYLNVPGLNQKVLKDLFHTIMDAKWRYFALLFTLSFLVSWVIFAAIWYIIVVARTKNCIDNVDSFTAAFLFSVETQVTIGYGGRAVTDECPEGIIFLIIQTIIGTFINCALLGLLFAKLARPKNRGKTIVFSKKAVITKRDDRYCLIFRYVDLRERKLLDSNMRLICIRPRLTKEGDYIPLDMSDLPITIDYKQVEFTLRLFPIYPVSLLHVIDEDSPLYSLSKSNLENTNFELIAILEGTVPGTGNTTQAITSYKPREILWGSRFKPIFLGVRRGHSSNCLDLGTLNHTSEEDKTPSYSAKEHDKHKKEKLAENSIVAEKGKDSSSRCSSSSV